MGQVTYHTIAHRERSLIRRAQRGDDAAVETLLEAHAGFLRRMAHHYSRIEGYEFDDAMQEARCGFVIGIRRFDLKTKTRLLTFAAWWMRHYIRRELQNTVGDVRLPVYQQDTMKRRPIRAKRLDVPLRTKDGDGDMTLADLLVANEPAPDDEAHEKRRQRVIKAAVEQALTDLDEREREIARRRLAQHWKDRATLSEIGRRFGISRERVRQVERHVVAKLRLRLAKRGGAKLLAA